MEISQNGNQRETWIQTQADPIIIDQNQSQEAFSPSQFISLVPIGFILIWTIAIVLYFILSKTVRTATQDVKLTFSYHNAPCRKCRFFNSSPYLKCAVHPTTVTTKSAIDCSDYQPQETAELPSNQLKH